MLIALLLAGSYVFGSLPFGLMIAKWWKGIDVRDYGSGNIGATNVYRVVGKTAGAVVFALDVLKGLLPPLMAGVLGLGDWARVGAGFASILGHNFSPFLGFKGGKGVSTSLGVLFGVAPKVGFAAWVLWGLLLAATGYVSVGSIIAAAALAPFSLLFYRGQAAIFAFCIVAGVFSIVKHKGNIVRLMNGTENSFKKKREGDDHEDDNGEKKEKRPRSDDVNSTEDQ